MQETNTELSGKENVKAESSQEVLEASSEEVNAEAIEETEIKDETISNTITQENEIKQETIVSAESTENEISYMGIGFIGVSIIFFMMTIIFFIKYQLKSKKKLSK